MKKYWKRVLAICLLCLIMAFLWVVADRTLILKRGDGVTPVLDYYEQPENTIDLLLIGSSHVGMNIDVETLWTQRGISGYSLWGSLQPFWNTYYLLKEALKTQQPRVVVLDVYAVLMGFDYSDEARQVTNISGMHLNQNKLDAIRISAPKERWLELAIGMPIYHSRFDSLTKEDFIHYPWSEGQADRKGTGVRYGTNACVPLEVADNGESSAMLEKEEIYLRKIIEECQERRVPLVLLTTPTDGRTESQPYYNYVQSIADEYGITYLNLNVMDNETGITQADYWTDDNHLNTKGSRKVAAYLGDYLVKTYALPDHRGEAAYASWDRCAVMMQNEYIKSITEVEDYFAELAREERTVIIMNRSLSETDNAAQSLSMSLNRIGVVGEEIFQNPNEIWLKESTINGTAQNISQKMENGLSVDGTQFSITETEDGILFKAGEQTVCTIKDDGVICIVYDKNTHAVIDAVGFSKDNDYLMEKL